MKRKFSTQTMEQEHKINTVEDDPTQRIIYQYFTLHAKI